jgi:signal peptidase I
MNPEPQSDIPASTEPSARQSAPQSPFESAPKDNYPEKKGSFLGDIVKFAIIAIIIVLPIRLFIAQPYIVSGASMEPTFETGQYVLVDELSYHFSQPERGQVVIFKYPKDTSVSFIKRIIGLPGETVVLSGTSVTIKNSAHPDGFTLNEPYVAPENQSENYMTVTLGPNEYWVMGDNRRESSDSRSWGPVPANDIIGTPFVRLYPLTVISAFPGIYPEPN